MRIVCKMNGIGAMNTTSPVALSEDIAVCFFGSVVVGRKFGECVITLACPTFHIFFPMASSEIFISIEPFTSFDFCF